MTDLVDELFEDRRDDAALEERRDSLPTVVHPGTGELINLRDAATDDLGRFLDEVRDYESRLREAKGLVTTEVVRRMDLEGQWTMRAGGFVLSAPSPAPAEEFDGKGLYSDLAALVFQGTITQDAAERAVKITTTYTPSAMGIKALRKLGGVVAETIAKHATPVEKKRYVKVGRP